MSEFMPNGIDRSKDRESPVNSTHHCGFCNAVMSHENSDSKLHT
ncbi:hypothetical protein ACQKEN_22295 [Pseudomonas sp. NPDC078416]